MSALVKNISLPTYSGDGTNPQMSALVKKPKSSYLLGGRMNQATNECLGKKSKSCYLWKGWMNEATKCLGKKPMSSYL